MKIFYCGDVVGRPGREAVLNNLKAIREQYNPDVFIVNIENAAHGFGVTPAIADEMFAKGVDVLISGNHIYQQREIIPYLNANKNLIRPLNYPEDAPGRGHIVFELANGKKILITQVLCRLFMEAVDNPAAALDKLLTKYALRQNVDAIFVDIHGEATSEKLALGHYLDGRVSVAAGTHTHVPTSDAKVMPGGTAYITDVGMCGDYNGVLGFDKEEPINRLRQKYTGGRLTVAKGPGTLYGIYVETNDKTGLAAKIEQVKI